METSGMSFITMIIFFNHLKNVFFHISKCVQKEIRRKFTILHTTIWFSFRPVSNKIEHQNHKNLVLDFIVVIRVLWQRVLGWWILYNIDNWGVNVDISI